jgi:hypothetical protein
VVKVTERITGFIEAVDAEEAEELWPEDRDFWEYELTAEEYKDGFCQCESGK